MTTRRPGDGWLCKNCGSVFFTHENRCPWCFRDDALTPAERRPHVRRKLRDMGLRLKRLTTRDGWDCWLCGQPVDPYDLGLHRASADHVLPKCMGGTWALDNLRLAHQSCNGYRAGTKCAPFAPFDNSAAADMARRKAVL